MPSVQLERSQIAGRATAAQNAMGRPKKEAKASADRIPILLGTSSPSRSWRKATPTTTVPNTAKRVQCPAQGW